MTIHELRDKDGNVIHACATASFPLPKDHWIYQDPVEPEHHIGGLYDDGVQANIEEKARDALKYTIQVCTRSGKEDFDPDAMLMEFRNTLFGIGRSVVGLLILLLLASSCYAQDNQSYSSSGYQRFGSSTARWSTNPPKLYSSSGVYLGELSQNRYRSDSVSNPYSRYGSRYSPTSVNNPYSRYGQYRTQPIYIYQGW